MKNYYMTRLDNDIKTRAGRWHLEEIGVKDPKRGITNNAAESYNNMIKHMKGTKTEKPSADLTISQMYSFEGSLHNQVVAAYYGCGRYKLKDEYMHLQQSPLEMPGLFNTSSEEIMAQIREFNNAANTMGKEAPGKSADTIAKERQTLQIQQRALPLVLEDFRVQSVAFKPGDNVYAVLDTNDQRYLVDLSLGKLGSCTCPSTTFCQHRLAARVKAGIQKDLAIPPGAKLGNAKTAAKPHKGRAPIHGTKRPIPHDLHHNVFDAKRKAKTVKRDETDDPLLFKRSTVKLPLPMDQSSFLDNTGTAPPTTEDKKNIFA